MEPFMDISGVNRAVSAVTVAEAPVTAQQNVERRDVVQAVRAVNSTEMFGPENELRFQKDPQSHRMVVRVVNRKTDEVVTQIPPEYVLRLAADLKHS